MFALLAGKDKISPIRTPDDAGSIVVALQGVRLDNPETWTWLRRLSGEALPEPAIYSFLYDCPSASTSFCKELLGQGGDLVVCLEQIAGRYESTLPIVLVSHSLGGLLVKKALCLISEHSNNLSRLYDAIAAAVFLGTPHGKTSRDGAWTTAYNLLRPRKGFRRSAGTDVEDAEALIELFRNFNGAIVDLPILTVFEDQASVTGTRRLSFNRSATIVGRGSVIGSKCETLLPTCSDHASLCHLSTVGQIPQRLTDFLKPSIAAAIERIAAHDHRTPPVIDFFESTIGSPSRWSQRDGTSYIHGSDLDTQSVVSPTAEAQTIGADAGSREPVPLLPCHDVPYERNKHFFGREDLLAEMRQRLFPDSYLQAPKESDEHKTFAICGPGGMGKTQAAAQFALTSTHVFEVILWMRADTHAKLATDFNKAAVKLGLVREGSLDAKDLAVTRELVKGWLSTPRRHSDRSDRLIDDTATWLLVFDNADESDVLSDFWPTGSGGSILITSRDPRGKTIDFRVRKGKDLKPFSTVESAELLMMLTQRQEEPDQWGPAVRTAEALRGFPLALTQMASVIVSQEWTFDRFLSQYEQGSEEMFSARPASSNYQHTLATVFALDKLSDSARRLLGFLSLVDSDISETDIIEPILGKFKLLKFPNTASDYEKAREELTRSSLVSHNRKNKTLSVNILVQDAACARMSSYEFVPVFGFAVRLLSKLWPKAMSNAIRQDNRRWKECEKLSQHALRLKDRLAKQSSGVKDELALHTQYATLLNEVGWYLQERGQSQYAMECFTIARDHFQKILANEQANSEGARPAYSQQSPSSFNELGDTNTSHALANDFNDTSVLYAETFRNLGTAAADICDVSTSYDNYQRYNNLMLEQLGDHDRPTDPRLAISYLELAVAHAFRLEYEDSKTCSETALALCRYIPSSEMVMNLRTLAAANLSLALLELGDATQARDQALEALNQREGKLGPDDRTSMLTGRLLHALGNIFFRLGEKNKSLNYHMRAMTHYKETIGPSHHRTADMCFKVAEHQIRIGQPDEARKLLDQARHIYQGQKQHYQAELARVLHWEAKLAPPEDIVLKTKLAADMLKKARAERGVSGVTFEDADFDRMVVFWSR